MLSGPQDDTRLIRQLLPRSTYDWETYRVQDIAWSPDGKSIAIVSRSQACGPTLQVLGIQSEQTHCEMYEDDQHAYLNDISWSSDGNLLAVAHGRTVDLWQCDDWRNIRFFDVDFTITAICWSPDANWLAIHSNKQLRIWSRESSDLYAIATDISMIHAVCWHPDSAGLAIATDQQILFWNVDDHKARSSLDEKPRHFMIWSANTHMLAFYSAEQMAITIIDPTTKNIRHRIALRSEIPLQACFSANGAFLATKWATGDSDHIEQAGIEIWRTDNWEKVDSIGLENEYGTRNPDQVAGLTFHPNSRQLAASSPFSWKINIWSISRMTTYRDNVTLNEKK